MTRLSADQIKNLFPKLKQNTDETSEPNIQSDKTMGRVLWIEVKWNVGGSWKWWNSKQTFTVLPGAWRRRMAMARKPQLCSPVMKWARVDRELETINSRTGWLLPIWANVLGEEVKLISGQVMTVSPQLEPVFLGFYLITMATILQRLCVLYHN